MNRILSASVDGCALDGSIVCLSVCLSVFGAGDDETSVTGLLSTEVNFSEFS